MEARAIAKNVRMSASKVRPVADLVRDVSVERASDVLRNTDKKAAGPLRKAIESAFSNLEDQEPTARVSETHIKELRVDEGITLKRWRPRAMGRATSVKKRATHIKVVVTTDAGEA